MGLLISDREVFNRINSALKSVKNNNPMLFGSSPGGHLWEAVIDLYRTHKDHFYIVLEFQDAHHLLFYLKDWLKSIEHTEVAAKLCLLLTRLRYHKIQTATHAVFTESYLALHEVLTFNL